MELIEVIRRFIERQSYVRKRLQAVFGVPEDVKARDWAYMHLDLMEKHRKNPVAEVFRPHGYGIEFRDDTVHIDFDYCLSGRPDGFDAWRLLVFCEDNGLDTEMREQGEFESALSELAGNGVVEEEANLFFVKRPTRLMDPSVRSPSEGEGGEK
jgi:hypothetical protein